MTKKELKEKLYKEMRNVEAEEPFDKRAVKLMKEYANSNAEKDTIEWFYYASKANEVIVEIKCDLKLFLKGLKEIEETFLS